MFKRCYAMEKIHGSSSHISFRKNRTPQLSFFAGGEKHERFVAFFNQEELLKHFPELGHDEVTVFGEVYGGKCQGMGGTYGADLRFIAFDVKIGDCFVNVPVAEKISIDLGLEFVPYVEISTDLSEIDAQRDAPSIVAQRRGMGSDKKREGIVLRPLMEMTGNNRERICAKHKIDKFGETKTPRQVTDEELKVLSDAEAIADEWVTEQRLSHVLQRIENVGIDKMRDVITAMIEDVTREGSGEIVDSKEARKAISKRTSTMFKSRLQEGLKSIN